MHDPLKWVGNEFGRFLLVIKKSKKNVPILRDKGKKGQRSRIKNGQANVTIGVLMGYLNPAGYTILIAPLPDGKTIISVELRELLRHYSIQEILAVVYQRKMKRVR